MCVDNSVTYVPGLYSFVGQDGILRRIGNPPVRASITVRCRDGLRREAD
jgi:hypothetical protein